MSLIENLIIVITKATVVQFLETYASNIEQKTSKR